MSSSCALDLLEEAVTTALSQMQLSPSAAGPRHSNTRYRSPLTVETTRGSDLSDNDDYDDDADYKSCWLGQQVRHHINHTLH
jgi:hypothetical protein